METIQPPLEDFHKIWCLSNFRKCIRKIQDLLWSAGNNGQAYFAWRSEYNNISPWIVLKMRKFSDKIYRKESTHTFLNSIIFFKNIALYEIMWKATVKPDSTQIETKLRRGKVYFSCRITNASIQTNTMFNTRCFIVELSFWPRIMFYGNIYKNWKTTERKTLLCNSNYFDTVDGDMYSHNSLPQIEEYKDFVF